MKHQSKSPYCRSNLRMPQTKSITSPVRIIAHIHSILLCMYVRICVLTCHCHIKYFLECIFCEVAIHFVQLHCLPSPIAYI